MSRKPNIKWRDRDAQELEKAINRFNSKIYRSRKKYNNWMHLPRPILANDKKALVEKLQSAPRTEFNKQLRSMSRFSSVKGAEKPVKAKSGNVVSAWEKKETSIKVGLLNRKRSAEKKRIQELDATHMNKPVGMKRGQMEDRRIADLKPIAYDFDKKQGGREWESFQRMLDNNLAHDAEEKKYQLYKDNLIKGIQNAHGVEGQDIVELIEQLPADAVVEKYFREEQATIDFAYDKAERDKVLGVLRRIWGSVADEQGVEPSEYFKEKREEAFKAHSRFRNNR